MATKEHEEILRSALFVPCDTKEHLHKWIKVYLGMDIPNVIVCDDDVRNPPSNSSPMDLIWEIYSKARDGKDENFTRVLGFAARDSFKTLSSAILETLCLFHLGRNVGHMAALEAQAKNCQRYIEGYLKRPILREFMVSKNKRMIEITRYNDVNGGRPISPIEYNKLDSEQKKNYEEKTNWVKIVIATVEDANGLHVPFFVCDELDLADPAAYAESLMIPSMGEGGQLPITFLTSTRKYSFGLVQKEIDKAHTTGLNIRHWNVIDVTEKCPPSRHLPEEPQIPIYYSESMLRAISKEEYDILSEKEKQQYDVKIGFKGCLAKCKLFSQCQGRLATKQTSTSPMLKKLHHVQPLFQAVSNEHAKAQLMCWQPSSEGKIYPNFTRETHLIPASTMAEKVTGEEFPPHFNKAELIELFKRMGAEFYSGLDWGFTHNFAVVTAALLGHNLFIFDVISVKGLELQQRIELCKEKLGPLSPSIYPDNAYPSDVKSFKTAGFKMINFRKDVLMGIENARKRIMPGGGLPASVFLLKDDPGCEFLASKIIGYHWKTDQQGNLTDEPYSQDDDELDAFRYLCQNVPLNKTNSVTVASDSAILYKKDPNKGWITRHIGGQTSETVEITGKPGGLLFTI